MMFLTIWLKNFFLAKVLWEHHSIENLWHTIFFFSFGIDPRKVPMSKTVSLRSKTFRYNSLETREFLWVKTPMGIKVHFRDFFCVFVSEFLRCSNLTINVVVTGLVILNADWFQKSYWHDLPRGGLGGRTPPNVDPLTSCSSTLEW